MNEVSENFIARVSAVLQPEAPAHHNLSARCSILGGVDDESRTALVIWLAYASKATTSSVIAHAQQAFWRLMEDGLTNLLQPWNPALLRDDAAMLMALLDGPAIARAVQFPICRVAELSLKTKPIVRIKAGCDFTLKISDIIM